MLRPIVVVLLAFVPAVLPAQSPRRADADFLRQAYSTYQAMRRASPYGPASWSFLGPTNISGRATSVAVANTNAGRRIYAGYATGGVWKSDDNGASWQSIFDDMPSTSIGDIAVAPANPDIVWVGTGESNIYRASMAGAGVYKSIDSGRTWLQMGLTDTQTIARIVVHPTESDTVYVAASGHEWSDNEMRGVFKTTDGGRTWRKVLYGSARTGVIDLAMDPSDPKTLYAAAWQRIRRKWSDPRVEPGYDESGIYKTTDGGETWTALSRGLPEASVRGRIGVAIAPSNPKVVYALIDNYQESRPARSGERDAYGRPITNGRIKGAEIYRSDDGGALWRKMSDNSDFMLEHSGTYGWVFGQVRVDPKDENTVYSLGINLNVSHDGGRSFSKVDQPHADNHGLWIDPAAPRVLYNATDGGLYLSDDAGRTWRFAQSAHTSQFYDVVLDTAAPFHAYGSIQDTGSRRGTIDVRTGRDPLQAVAFDLAPGGEGSHHAIDPQNPNIVYSHQFYGNFTRTDLSQTGGDRHDAGVKNIQPDAAGEALRAQWMAPIVLSPHDPAIVYAGYQFLFRSPDRGDSWRRISLDLTSNDPDQMLPLNASAVPYQTIASISESPRRAGVIYAGTDDGRLHVTMDNGTTWSDLTAHLPARKWISRVVASQHDDGTVYVTQRGREDDDFAAYVYKSTNFGRTFTSIGGSIPAGSVNVIREDPLNGRVLVLGTDFGAFVSTNGGGRWEVLGGNLPSVQVSDLQYHPREKYIVISTYGRGMWGMDATKIK